MQVNHVSFHDDINLHLIYEDSVSILTSSMDNLSIYEKEYNTMKRIATMSHSPSDRSKATTAIRNMDKVLPYLRDRSLLSRYQRKVLPLLSRYDEICGRSRIFGMDKCTNIPMRVGLIMTFLEETYPYTGITYTCSFDMTKICSKCYNTMRKCGPIMVCNHCGFAYKIERMIDINMDDTGSRTESTYDASKNFKKEYAHVCGISNDIRDGQKEDIESYLYRAGFKDPTHENVRDAIRACGYNNYHDTNLLYHRITGQPLPDIYQYIDICSARFEQYFRVFHLLENREGQNITNIHFLIKLFLWQEGVSYNDVWFRSLSLQTETKHIRNAKKVCVAIQLQKTDTIWKYPPSWD